MSWSFKLASEAFPHYREMWDDLNRAHGNHLLLDSMNSIPHSLLRGYLMRTVNYGSVEYPVACGGDLLLFLEPLLRHFGNSPRTLLGVCNEKKNPGLVLIEKTKLGFWQTFQPSQAPIALIVLGNHEAFLD
jgi:hypothetical protein